MLRPKRGAPLSTEENRQPRGRQRATLLVAVALVSLAAIVVMLLNHSRLSERERFRRELEAEKQWVSGAAMASWDLPPAKSSEESE